MVARRPWKERYHEDTMECKHEQRRENYGNGRIFARTKMKRTENKQNSAPDIKTKLNYLLIVTRE